MKRLFEMIPRITLCAALMLVACGERPVLQPDASVSLPRFEPDAVAQGPALWTEGVITESGDLQVSVWARELGPVFGYAFRLTQDATLSLAPGQVVNAETLLGPNTPREVVYFSKLTERGLLVGAARQGPAAMERNLTAPTQIVRLLLRTTATAGRVALRDVSVRRANGESLSVAVGGGRYLPAGAP